MDFNAQFHVTHIVMKWQSFRPAAMLIEKSYDYQKSWSVQRYYAKSCEASFPGVPVIPPEDITKPYCTSEYSDIEPSSGGEVEYCGWLFVGTPQKKPVFFIQAHLK